MLRSLILNISKIIVAFAIISVGVMGYLWLENTKETVFVEKVEESSFFVDTKIQTPEFFRPSNMGDGFTIFSTFCNFL